MTEQELSRPPLSPEQQKELFATADKVEHALDSLGMPLLMGGEPTFIPRFAEGAEWSVDAMGPTKLDYARALMRTLLDKHYPGALVMQIFGKWYPGEPLPRWVLLGLWAEDGTHFWQEHDRLIQPGQTYTNTNREAEALIESIATKTGMGDFVVAASNPDEEQNCGWLLPLDHAGSQWTSSPWPFSREHPIELFQGDSPIGLRIPLFKLGENICKKAFTVEARDGVLEVFIPPLDLEGFRKMLRLIEDTLVALDLKGVVLCGYAPSETGDDLTRFGLAADPGVLEANIPPSQTWQQYHDFLLKLNAAAVEVGLCAWKAKLNGHMTGTGGGNHLCFGGPSPQRSPFLRQPALLASIIRYWQHHPALSYLFTGQFIGPSSQAPRSDEGIAEALYELEIACRGASQLSADPDPKTVDKLFRDLLTDRTGNTHRTEICIDKLWNPHAPNGRFGILEFRAFEMFPSIENNTLIALLIRAIIARLATTPFTEPFRDLSRELHDKYFLPAFLEEDLATILTDLTKHGFPFQPEWFQHHFEFRFPLLGQLEIPGGNIQVRQAPESWPLLGEQPSGASTSRHVDSSTDRLEILISDAAVNETGYLLINGYPVRFLQAGNKLVCGVRYKAVKLLHGLHPHIESQSPIMIEWVDRETSKVQAAAAYHFWNPEGHLYDGMAKSIEDASTRQKDRWRPYDANLGAHRFIPDIDFPHDALHTLDLRRYPTILK